MRHRKVSDAPVTQPTDDLVRGILLGEVVAPRRERGRPT